MPGDLSIGGGVYIYIPSAVGYWDVTGVTEPQHYWPFAETGDYTDQGSEGGLDMSAGGGGNSFDSGLVVNGSGWAEVGNDADLCSLGSTWSLLFDIGIVDISCGFRVASVDHSDLAANSLNLGQLDQSFEIQVFNGGSNDTFNHAGFYSATGRYQIILTYTGGNMYVYKNGSSVDSKTMIGPGNNTTNPFHILNTTQHSQPAYPGTKMYRCGVLKGTAWSADDVAAIYTAFS